ncbi:hypothetical protein KIL84_002066 [Mauremys mutica]|uniref:Uncharacterized protein n=1 Tax=Mauremys mutica TaxID=74926 RepID=A0A9D3XJJ5_9SAUR|nr:hypothetical protein KIL84_002066 [Mauremys mutica]
MREFLNEMGALSHKRVHLPHPPIFEENKQQLSAEQKDQTVAVILDDYTDSLHWHVANIRIQRMQVSDGCPAATKLVETVEVGHVNYAPVAQAVTKTLVQHEIDLSNAGAYGAGNAKSLRPSFKDRLSGVLTNGIPVTFWAHVTALPGEC